MRVVLILLAVAGCAGGLPDAESRYVGRSVPQGVCGMESSATLVVRGLRFNFAPTDGALIIAGDVATSGKLTGSLARAGIDGRPFTMTFDAEIANAEVKGTYTTPRCRFEVKLHRR